MLSCEISVIAVAFFKYFSMYALYYGCWNCFQVIQQGHGVLIVARRPIPGTPAYKYAPCTYCYGFYPFKTLSLHAQTCIMNGSKSKSFSNASASHAMLSSLIVRKEGSMLELLQGLRTTSKNPGEYLV